MTTLKPYSKLAKRLNEWGAKIITTKDTFETTKTFDFHSPMPGDQPIASSVELEGYNIIRGTMRYGVLTHNDERRHRTDIRREMDRLSNAFNVVDKPKGVKYALDFGDTHRKPRPHLLINWEPSDRVDINYRLIETKPRGEPEPPTIHEAMNMIVRYGEVLKREFEGEWEE